jgi:AraC family transcriptional regulator, ethanolamine operon transcriptional activator
MAQTLLPQSQFSVNACVARDAWTHGAALNGWLHEYEQVKPGRFSGIVETAWMGPLQIIHERIDHSFNYRGTPWAGSRVFFSYLPGSGDAFYDNRPIGTSTLVTHRWNGVDRISCSDKIKLLIVAIDEDYFTQYLAPLPGFETLVRTPQPVCYASNPDLVGVFQRTVFGMLQELIAAPHILSDERLRAGLQQRVLDSILAVIGDTETESRRPPAPSTRAYIVGRAIDYIEPRLADPISVRDLCASIRVCPRTLSYAFSEVLGASPKAYLLASRLNRAYRDLADPRVHASVQSIAARWGFSHMGRFAQYYRTAFGELPSATYASRAARGVPAGLRQDVRDTLARLPRAMQS